MATALIGVDNTLKALRQVTPDIYKAMRVEIKPAMQAITSDAKDHVPASFGGLSSFDTTLKARKSRTNRSRAFPSYDPSVVKRGLTYSIGTKKPLSNGWAAIFSILNKSAVGAIIETAGRANPSGSPKSQSNNPNAGSHFISALNHGSGNIQKVGTGRKTEGRLAWASVKRDEGKVKVAIQKALNDAIDAYNVRISAWQ